MARLPIPGADNGLWGDVLNDFLLVTHQDNGSLKNGIISNSNISSSANIAQSKIASLSEDLAAKAANTGVVHNTGAELIEGVKTFASSPNSSGPFIQHRRSH